MIVDTPKHKIIKTDAYNLYFRKSDGYTLRWAETMGDDPDFAPFPEILDMEISTGACMGKCKFCYKNNGEPKLPTRHMSLDTFKSIMDRFEVNGINCLTQIALGLTDTISNPDFWNILQECRNRGVVPNFTTHGLDMTPEIAEKVSKLCGAVAVSIVNKNKSYDAVKMLTDAGMTQINIHLTIYKERVDDILSIIEDIKVDPRLAKLNAIVLLTYKPKGRNVGGFTNLTQKEFNSLINVCDDAKINYGMDSCSCGMYEQWIKEYNREELLQYCEKCESGLMSFYCNVDGVFYPCSFGEGEEVGQNILDYDHILDLWNGEVNLKWRKKTVEK